MSRGCASPEVNPRMKSSREKEPFAMQGKRHRHALLQLSGLEPFPGDKAGLSTCLEIPAISTAPTQQLSFSLLPIHTCWSFQWSPRALPKGLHWEGGASPSDPHQSQVLTHGAWSLFIPPTHSLSLSQMVMSGLHWELNEVDCPLVSAISGN